MALQVLDKTGVKFLIDQLANYPDNTILAAVINGIDMAKLDKPSDDTPSGSLLVSSGYGGTYWQQPSGVISDYLPETLLISQQLSEASSTIVLNTAAYADLSGFNKLTIHIDHMTSGNTGTLAVGFNGDADTKQNLVSLYSKYTAYTIELYEGTTCVPVIHTGSYGTEFSSPGTMISYSEGGFYTIGSIELYNANQFPAGTRISVYARKALKGE